MKKLFLIAGLVVTANSFAQYQSDSARVASKKEAHRAAWKATVASTVLIVITKPKTALRYLAVGLFAFSMTGVIVTSGE